MGGTRNIGKLEKNSSYRPLTFRHSKTSTAIPILIEGAGISNRHLHIYVVEIDSDVAPTVYVEDLSKNGTLLMHSDVSTSQSDQRRFLVRGQATALQNGDILHCSYAVKFLFEANATVDNTCALKKASCEQRKELKVQKNYITGSYNTEKLF